MTDGYVPVPNSIARDARLSPQARAFYVVLRSYAHGDRTSCWPGRKTLATDMGVSIATVTRLTNDLVEAGLVVVTQRPNRSNVYWFGPSDRLTHEADSPQPRVGPPAHPRAAEEDKVKKTRKARGTASSTSMPAPPTAFAETKMMDRW